MSDKSDKMEQNQQNTHFPKQDYEKNFEAEKSRTGDSEALLPFNQKKYYQLINQEKIRQSLLFPLKAKGKKKGVSQQTKLWQ